MTIKIIKNAEMPKPRANYPFADMEVGDAFDYPGGSTKVATAAFQWRKRNNPAVKFTVRKIDENTVRCWRVA